MISVRWLHVLVHPWNWRQHESDHDELCPLCQSIMVSCRSVEPIVGCTDKKLYTLSDWQKWSVVYFFCNVWHRLRAPFSISMWSWFSQRCSCVGGDIKFKITGCVCLFVFQFCFFFCFKWPPKKDSVSPKPEVPACLRLVIWLGLELHAGDWLRCADEGEISVFAETVSGRDDNCYTLPNDVLS